MPADPPEITPPALPVPVPAAPAPPGLPAHLEGLAETARDYARGAKAANTQRAYASDWKHFTAWCRRRGLDDPDLSGPSGPLPPAPQVVGLYLAASASEKTAAGKPGAVRTIERRL